MSGWFGLGGGKEVEEPSGVEIVKKLSSRIASATLLEDRRDSVRAIKVISRDFKTTSQSESLNKFYLEENLYQKTKVILI